MPRVRAIAARESLSSVAARYAISVRAFDVQRAHDARAHRIQMDIADQIQEVVIVTDWPRFVSILD